MALKNNRVNINDGGNRTRVDQHYSTRPTQTDEGKMMRKTQARRVASNPASGAAMNATKAARSFATKQAYNTATKKAVSPDEMRSAYSAFRKQAKKR